MARQGGYTRSTKDEWLKTTRERYAEAIQSAGTMGQTLEVWLADAIEHHAYRCEQIIGREAYARACAEAAARMDFSPLEADFKPKRPPPTISPPTVSAGGASGGRNPRP